MRLQATASLASAQSACFTNQMSLQPGKRSCYRPRIWTFIALIVVAAPVVVANLSHAPRPGDAWPPPNAAYGWPLIWYWCEFTPVLTELQMTMDGGRVTPRLAQWSRGALAANLAAWLILAACVALACELLLRRYGPRAGYRPRLLTFVVLAIGVSLIVLANLSSDAPMGFVWPPDTPRYGWPLIWRWRDIQIGYGAFTVLDQNYQVPRLVANLAAWLLMLVAVAASCEWLLRRYPPRLRWSLRTMLAAVAVIAAACAWCVKLRTRANFQDPVISLDDADPNWSLEVERWGQKWLNLVGADRFRRSIVGVDLPYANDDKKEEILKRLARLPDLRALKLDVSGADAGVAALLADLRQIRKLRFRSADLKLNWRECLAAIGKLEQLEDLNLGGVSDSESLPYLAGLTNLKSLSIRINWDDENESDEDEEDNIDDAAPFLARLPALPRLEMLTLRFGSHKLDEREIRHLAVHPRLKSIDLDLGNGAVTEAVPAELASLKTLDELAIGGNSLIFAKRLHALRALRNLKALHLQSYMTVTKEVLAALPLQDSRDALAEREAAGEELSAAELDVLEAFDNFNELRANQDNPAEKPDRLAAVALDRGDWILVLESEAEDVRRALAAVRKANQGIVIDSDAKWFEDEELPSMSGGGMF